MIRRLNFTGRKSIPRDCVTLTVTPDGDTHRVDAVFNLAGLGLPSDARLAVEAYHQNAAQRFDWGTAGNPSPPPDRRLVEFEDVRGVKFRVKAILQSPDRGRLAADSSGLSPRTPESDDGKRRPLLPVCGERLDGEPWRLEIQGQAPQLKIESSLGDAVLLSRSPRFQALVYPAVVRMVLTDIASSNGGVSLDDATDWRRDWLLFATSLPGVPTPPSGDDRDEIEDWIQSVVHSFCRKFHLTDLLAAELASEER